jgi:hypothetical protein
VTSASATLVRVFSEREDQSAAGHGCVGRFSEVRIRGFELDFGEVLKPG